MQFKQKTTKAYFEELENSLTYHIFYLENNKEPTTNNDINFFLGSDYATSVICKNKEELDLLFKNINEEEYEILKSEFNYNGIHAIEVNNIFLVALEIDYFSEEKCEFIMSNFIVVGSQCDDVPLSELFKYRKDVKDNKLPDRTFEDLENFYQDDFEELKDEYIDNNKEEEYEELDVSIDLYLRIVDYSRNEKGNQKDKLDFILDTLHEHFYI